MTDDFTPVRILQITDTHLFADRHGCLHGTDTRRNLANIVELALQAPPPDLVLTTGDLVQDGSPAGYQALFKILKALKTPVAVIAGNHDNPDALRENLPKSVRLGGVHLLGAWRAVLLNSQLPGEARGHLDNAELYFLRAALEAAGEHHVLVVLHHNPVPVGSAWLDRIALDNPDALFGVLHRFPNVHAVLCGHVHQELDTRADGLRILATPATSVQFRPHSPDFALDAKPPGMRWLTLRENGLLETQVERLTPQV
ncbi:MAG: 3',5'-cyclic-AMP phosphodiesterase [Gammaproteobacteria bacterium]